SGETGSGKTTLFKAVLKMLHSTYDKFILFGKDFSGMDRNEIGAKTAFAFQESEASFTEISVRDELNTIVNNNEKISEFIEIFKFEKYLEMNPFKLSQSEKRLLSLSCLFNPNKQLILLDEPTSDLDHLNRKKILELLQNSKTPMIILTHDLKMGTVLHFSEKILNL
ncbi:MAG TPA: ATP-binding cassette domain-containing protein, partial [Firmicutes bacterium]|nr:ATP-binding cassette domain-containing protein [Bacillota bacterium]